jgi:hypothetical protein
MIFAEVPDRGHTPFLDEPQALAAMADWLALLPGLTVAARQA